MGFGGRRSAGSASDHAARLVVVVLRRSKIVDVMRCFWGSRGAVSSGPFVFSLVEG